MKNAITNPRLLFLVIGLSVSTLGSVLAGKRAEQEPSSNTAPEMSEGGGVDRPNPSKDNRALRISNVSKPREIGKPGQAIAGRNKVSPVVQERKLTPFAKGISGNGVSRRDVASPAPAVLGGPIAQNSKKNTAVIKGAGIKVKP
jgi:hypothetical protein